MSHWSTHYIGISFVAGGRNIDQDGGLDCWGLVRYFYRSEYGIDLPEHPAMAGHLADAPELAATELNGSHWLSVNKPEEGDGIALGRDKHFSHVGIFVDIDGIPGVLHTCKRSFSAIQPLLELRSTGFPNIQFFRHAERR